MANLLELPQEIFQYICVTLVREHGVHIAVQALGTCKALDSEIVMAIYLTRALEGPDRPSQHVCDTPLLVEYLYLRTKNDCDRQYGLTAVIYDTIDSITKIAEEDLLPETDLLQEACLAITRAHKNLIYTLPRRVVAPTQLDASIFTTVGCTIEENTLAFAAHLGLITVVQKLLENGVSDCETDFGHALLRIVEQKPPLLTSIYLETKLDVSLNRTEKSPPYGTITNTTKAKNCDTARSHRGISWSRYDYAIRHAGSYGHVDTAKLLVAALCYDDAQSEPLERCCPTEHFRMGTMGTSSELGTRRAALITVLMTAVGGKRLDTAEMALKSGANPGRGRQEKCGFDTVLNVAALHGDSQMFNLLLENGINIWQTTCRHLLAFAVIGGSIDIARSCLEAGMTMFSRSDCQGRCRMVEEHPLLIALRHKHHEARLRMFQLLRRHGLGVEPGSKLDEELCKIATSFGDDRVLELLDQMRRETLAFYRVPASRACNGIYSVLVTPDGVPYLRNWNFTEVYDSDCTINRG